MTNTIYSYFKSDTGQQRLQHIGLIALMVGFCSLAIVLVFDILGVLICVIIVPIVFLVMFLFIRWDASIYCFFCRKRVHPLFKSHICEIDTKNMDLRLKGLISDYVKPHYKDIQQIINDLSNLQIFNNDGEKEIFRANMVSLKKLEKINDYKYVMIAMGSILEFLLTKYCKLNNISPESFTDPLGNTVPASKKSFVNYVQSAIINNLFGQEKSWHMVQNSLRDFRNYVHINKEIQEEKIDEGWYKSISFGFKRILSNFR